MAVSSDTAIFCYGLIWKVRHADFAQPLALHALICHAYVIPFFNALVLYAKPAMPGSLIFTAPVLLSSRTTSVYDSAQLLAFHCSKT